MEKRFVLFLVISVCILVAYQYIATPYLTRSPQKQAPKPEAQQQAAAGPETYSSEALPDIGAQAASIPEPEQAVAPEEYREQLEARAALVPREIVVKTPLYRAVITNKGGKIKSWRLANYNDNHGRLLELVPQGSIALGKSILELEFADKELTKHANTSLYEADRSELILSDTVPEATLRLSYIDPSGLKVTKALTFHAQNYNLDLELELENLFHSARTFDYQLNLIYGSHHHDKRNTYDKLSVSWLMDNELEQEDPPKPSAPLIQQGNISWAALQDNYFAAAFIPRAVTSQTQEKTLSLKALSLSLASPPVELAVGAKVRHAFGLYLGPQEQKKLAALGVGLEKMIDYGWFTFVAKPLVGVLRFLYRYCRNYGVAIILLTLLVKLLLHPLTKVSFKSMQEMQKIQPKMTSLREKYKKDPQQLNKEIMELYRKHNVNPMMGCLPMVLQIPVFFALYKVFLISIELRHAPFFLWVTDLSTAETGWLGLWQTPANLFGYAVPGWLELRLIVLIMGATMWLQQKMMPAGDPSQAKMMGIFMPLFFTVICWNMPTGLVLYFLVNNLLSIMQQYNVNKKAPEPKAVTVSRK